MKNQEIPYKDVLAELNKTRNQLEKLKKIHRFCNQDRDQLRFELGERIKELKCHNAISQAMFRHDTTLDEVLAEITRILPDSWQFPDRAHARISIREKHYASSEAEQTEPMMKQPVMVEGKSVGEVVVFYSGTTNIQAGHVFLKEEHDLLFSVSERIGNFIGKLDKERSMQQQQERYISFINALPDSMTITDTEGNIEFISPSVVEMFGLSSPEEANGRNILMYINENEIPKAMERLNALRLSGEMTVEEFIAVKQDGTTFPIEVNGNLIKNENGIPEKVVFITRDISQRKKIEQKLKKNENRFKQIASQSHTIIWEVDANGLYTYVNSISKVVWGYEPEEIIGKLHFYDLHPEEGREEFRKMALGVFDKKGKFSNIPNQIVTKSGKIIWVSTNGTPVTDENNNLTGYRGSDNDITLQREAEQKIRYSEEKFRSIFENVQDVYYEATTEGILLDISPSVSDLTRGQYNREELIGQSITKFYIDPADRVTFFNNLRKNGKVSDYELILRNRDNSATFVSITAKLVVSQDEFPDKIIGSMRDISERKIAEQALKKSEANLKYAQQIARMGSWHMNPISGETHWSENHYRILGYKTDEKNIDFDWFLKHVYPEDHHIIDDGLKLITKHRKPVTLEFRMLTNDNRLIWIEDNISPIFDGDKLIELRGSIIDITERKATEQKIKRQNDRLNAIIKANPDMVFILDRQGKYKEFYSSSVEELKHANETIVGNSLHSFFNQEQVNSHIARIDKCLNEKRLISYEYTMLENGNTEHFEARLVPFGSDEVLAQVRNITEKKMQDIEVLKLSMAVEQSPVNVMITDLDGRIEYTNRAFTYTTGYSREEALGKNPRILKSGKTSEAVYKDLWKTITSGKNWKSEWINRRKNGELYWEDVFISPIIDENNNLINYLAIKQDITERKSMDEALKKREDSLNDAQEIAGMGSWEFNLHNQQVNCSKNHFRLMGFKPYEVDFTYDLFRSLVHPDDLSRIDASFDIFEKSKKPVMMEIRLLMPDKSVKWLETHLVPEFENENLVKLNGVSLDITEKKRAEAEILELNASLEKKVKERTAQLAETNSKLLSEIGHRRKTQKELDVEKTRLAGIIEGTNVGTWEWNVQTGDIVFNKRSAEIIGYSLSEITPATSESWLKLTNSADGKKSQSLIDEHFSGKRPYYENEIRVKHKNGSWVWILDRGRVSKWSDDGRPLLMSGTHQDITERKKMKNWKNFC